MTARVAVPAEADLARIATQAGASSLSARRYEFGHLVVEGVTQQALDAALAEVGTAPFVPVPNITPLQMGLCLLSTGMLADVEAMVAAGPPELRLAWQRASVIERRHPMIAALAAQIGLSEAAVDHLFRLAAIS